MTPKTDRNRNKMCIRDSCYIADNKAGMAVTAEYKGFGGAVKVMIGIGANGEITGVKVTEHSETPGLGTKACLLYTSRCV